MRVTMLLFFPGGVPTCVVPLRFVVRRYVARCCAAIRFRCALRFRVVARYGSLMP